MTLAILLLTASADDEAPTVAFPAPGAGPAPQEMSVVVRLREGGRTARLLVKLPARPDPAGRWYVRQTGRATLALAEMPRFEPMPAGTGGLHYQVFRFDVTGAGAGRIEFHTRGPDGADEQIRVVNVTVEPAEPEDCAND